MKTREVAQKLESSRLVELSNRAKAWLDNIPCNDVSSDTTASAPHETVLLHSKTTKSPSSVQLATVDMKEAAKEERRRILRAGLHSSVCSDVIDNKTNEPSRSIQGTGSERSAFRSPNISDTNKEKSGWGADTSPLGSAKHSVDRKYTWGEKSEWSFQSRGKSQHVEPNGDESNETSLALWIGSSKKTTFSLWGSAGDAQPASQRPSLEANNLPNVLASEKLNSTSQPSLTTDPRSSQRSGFENRNGHGSLDSTSIWMTDDKSKGQQDRPYFPRPPKGLQNADRGSSLPQPNGQRGGLGRGADVNKPSWITHGKKNSVEQPAQQANNYSHQLQTRLDPAFGMASVDDTSSRANPMLTPTSVSLPAFSDSRPNAAPGRGRGRGRDMTMPAWLTNQQQHERP